MRQFLAIELSGALRGELRSLQEELQSVTTGWRWIKPESIHLTLRFLGEVPQRIDDRCRRSWREVAAAASRFRLRLDTIGSFPTRGRPRVLWVGIDEVGSDGRLTTMAAAFEQAARENGFEPESRPFRPHLTLARCRRSEHPTLPKRHVFVSRSVLDVHRAVLFRSDLLPAGARYSIVEELPLRTV